MMPKNMNRIFTCFTVGVLLTGLTMGAAYASAPLEAKVAEIVDAEARYDLFSGSVLVAKDGDIIYAAGVGEENKEYGVPNTLETKFNISSVQKTFVGTLIMQLCQEGVISLDDPIKKYYPECPWKAAGEVYISNLLNHTSGLGDYRDNAEYQANADNYGSIDDVLPLVFKLEEPTKYVPGSRVRYSNTGVLLAKGIIERVTGKKLKAVLNEKILQPLGMTNTTLFVGGELLQHRATAYRLSGDGQSYVRVLGEPSAYAGGGIYTCVLDLLKFDQALYGEDLLSEEYRNIMFTAAEGIPFGYGWVVTEFGGTSVIYHGGGSGGFNSEFRRYPEKGYTVIVLSNYEGAAYELANKIDCMLLDLPYSIATEYDRDFRLGMTCQDNNNYSEAVLHFEKGTYTDQPHMPSLYQLARTRLLGEFEQAKAIELLDRYISLADESTRPSIAAAWWRKGVAYEQLGNIDQAIACHEKCLELDETFEDARAALDRLKSGN
ncbi:MAG: serine hydrolase [Candidatus Zixiibacteriota bacterium]|nr:MAG: serine hydrolase [candidate division Zixibacteria bacterium]